MIIFNNKMYLFLEKIEAMGKYNPQYMKCPTSRRGVLLYKSDISIIFYNIIAPIDNYLSIPFLTKFSFIKNK